MSATSPDRKSKSKISSLSQLIKDVDHAVEPKPAPSRRATYNNRICLEDVVTEIKQGGFRKATKCPRERKVIKIAPCGYRPTNRFHHEVDLPHFGISMKVDSKVADYTPMQPMDCHLPPRPYSSRVLTARKEGTVTPRGGAQSSQELQNFSALKSKLAEARAAAHAFHAVPQKVVSQEPYLAYLRQSMHLETDRTREELSKCGIRPNQTKVTEAESELFTLWSAHLAETEQHMVRLGRTMEQIQSALYDAKAQRLLFQQFVEQRANLAPPPPSADLGSRIASLRLVQSAKEKAQGEKPVSRLQKKLDRDMSRQAEAFETLQQHQERHRETQHSALRRVFHRHHLRAKQLFNRSSRAMQEQIVSAREVAASRAKSASSVRMSANVLFQLPEVTKFE